MQQDLQQGVRQGSTRSVTLVLGGVRSGKSRYAQRLTETHARVTFVATAENREDDGEMRERIARHQLDRPAGWTTVEEPLALGRVLRSCEPVCDAILIDCLTLYAANLLEKFAVDEDRLRAEVEALCAALTEVQCSVVLVSNEVGSGVVPAYAAGRRFRDVAGEINQRVAAVADTVVLMVAGLPLVLKGSATTQAGAA